MEILENYPLAPITTFHIGGVADYFVSVSTTADLQEALKFAREKSLAVLVLGRGSNVLVSDEGFRGLVIKNEIENLNFEDSGKVEIGAGENWDDVVKQSVAKNLAGIECLSGVPGSAGGALVQNIGAYGQTLSDVVAAVTTVEKSTGKEKKFTLAECEFGYRTSWFKKNLNQYIVTGLSIQLKPDGPPTLTYAHVIKNFEKKNKPTLAELRDFIIKLRASKGYLIMDGFESYNTAGSFFKNPIISESEFEPLREMVGAPELNRHWSTPHGIKIAAAYLMQEAGFPKGYREGVVGISPKHSLSLTNFGGAKASEIKNLAQKIKDTVFKKFGVKLEEEVLYV